ncbi:MAG: tetratricopeptide repeat protein, partial [Cyanobacteria bacterium P01_G01_bin.54]
LADYSRALEIDPHYTYAYNGRGIVYDDLKQYEEALADYSKAIEIDPHYTYAYSNRGNAYKDLKQYEEALADYSKAIEIDPHYTYAYNGRGIVYDDLKRYEEALADYSKAIEIDPRYSTAYHNRGVAYRNLKRYEEAIKNYDTAIELDPTDYFPWWNRGWAKYNTSGYEAALKDWQNALDEHIQTRMEPLGCAILHWSIGEAHSYRARDNTEYILYWEATQSYETAYNLIQADDHHTEQTLEILQSWLIVLRKLHNPIQRQKRTLDAIQRLNKAIQNADPSYRKLLCTKFFDFFTLEVDQLVRRENKPWPALAEAEKWKTLALQWLSNPQAEPQEHQTDLQTRVNDLCKDSHTAILYWHLSPAQITTFLLRPDAKPQVFATPCDPPATQTNFVEWLKQYKKLYEAQRQKKNEDSVGAIPPWLPQAESSAAAAAGVGNKAAETKTGNEAAETGVGTGALPLQGEPDWQTQLPGLLEHLAEILNIDEILPHLANIQHLILIPHRDLHLLPLHALFQSFPTLLGKEGVEGEDPGRSPLAPLDKGGEDEGFHITYLPQLTPLPLPPAPLPHSSPLQSLEPHSGLLFAEMECACLAALYPETQPRSGDAVILDNMQTLPPSRVLHFAGHGIHNTSSPHQSALELNGGEQLTLGALLDPENPIALPPYALVCLAACETGMASQGDFINEFVGFPGALLSTGTHQVLSTLWTVREDATALLIVEFFTRWQAGTPASAALHQTQIWLRTASHTTLAQWYSDWVDHLKAKRDSRFQDLRERVQYHREQPDSAACPYANPYYWAGFVLMGLDV